MLNKFLVILLLVVTSNIALAACPTGPLTSHQANMLPVTAAMIMSARDRGVTISQTADSLLSDKECVFVAHPELLTVSLYLVIDIYAGKLQHHTPKALHAQVQGYVDGLNTQDTE